MRPISQVLSGCLGVVMCFAQGSGPHFEVASVKPAGGNAVFSGFTGGPGSSSPGRIQYSPVALRTLICDALKVKREQVSGPAWIDSLSYVVSATLPAQSTRQDLSGMILNLLAERFDFKFHRESRTLERLELHVESTGPKLGQPISGPGTEWSAIMTRNSDLRDKTGARKTDTSGFPTLAAGPSWAQLKGEDGLMRLTCKSCSMAFLGSMALATLVSRQQGMTSRSASSVVADCTDLPGRYDIHLIYAPVLPSTESAEASAPGEDLGTALRHQLGLRMVNVKAPVEVIVVDHLNRVPTEN